MRKGDNSLKQKADQSYTLCRFLPCIIHDLVPEDDPKWLFLLEFLYLVDYLMSPSFVTSDALILRSLIGR